MMAAIVISDSDSEFERDVQEATRRSLMTVAPSPVREVVSDRAYILVTLFYGSCFCSSCWLLCVCRVYPCIPERRVLTLYGLHLWDLNTVTY